MNYSRTIRTKVKRCHWPMKAADGAAVSGRAGRGGAMSAFGMWQGSTEEAGAETERRDEGGRGTARDRRGDFLLCSVEGGWGEVLEGRKGSSGEWVGGGRGGAG